MRDVHVARLVAVGIRACDRKWNGPPACADDATPAKTSAPCPFTTIHITENCGAELAPMGASGVSGRRVTWTAGDVGTSRARPRRDETFPDAAVPPFAVDRPA